MTNLTVLALVALVCVLVLGTLALLIFWNLAKTRTRATNSGVGWWQVLVGLATMGSAVIALATYLGP